MGDTTFAAATGTLGGYVAEPEGDGPFPGVVVVMDALGLSDDIRRQADRLAAAGFLAFAPDLYSGRGLTCVMATLKASRTGKGRAYEDLEAARRWLLDREDCTGRVGIIGFCMGGGFAVQSAPRGLYAAASVNYGELPKDPEDALAGACPVVGSYGARDLTLRGRADRLRKALDRHGIPNDVKEYPGAGHSFMNEVDTPLPDVVLRVTRFDHHPADAEDAWSRILAFFGEHLAQPADA
ncbi:dienelactone hydrolase family protein [Conexibacter sp. SYSU D00693]|uniref:dienelactone hydrolase family protein n=1 Tax=Conexibacter sp. SYSU D00693 TaxID=2812560 RepID=UPI00196A9F73|nr:dienelactone hydrolase family protein [Conexibacter sp. SYSU D00693]